MHHGVKEKLVGKQLYQSRVKKDARTYSVHDATYNVGYGAVRVVCRSNAEADRYADWCCDAVNYGSNDRESTESGWKLQQCKTRAQADALKYLCLAFQYTAISICVEGDSR
jgi:hypothetical protein